MGRAKQRDMTRAVGYIRVSTQQQASSGAGLEAQRAAILKAAGERGLILTQVFSDELSGKSRDGREGLGQALDLLRDGGADVLLVAKFDRLARSVWDFADLARQATREGWVISVLDKNIDMSTPMGKAMANTLMVFAELERDLTSERTKEALAVKRAQGVAIGRPWSVDLRTVERIEAMRTGGSTYRAIADALNEDQVPTGRGGAQWYPATVRGVLNRRRAVTS